MRYLYDLIFLLFSIIYLPYLIIKGKTHRDFIQRFGILPKHLKGDRREAIWVHAVSVGEVKAASPFVRHLKESFPEKKIILSTTTRTGNETAESIFGNAVPKFYFPLDFYSVVKKTVDFINPFAFILFETEIWPNLVTYLSNKRIPMILINGRISDRSYKGYRIIKTLFANILRRIDRFLMQTQEDAKRIETLGAPGDRVKVCGNVKYDVQQTKDPRPETTDLDKAGLGIAENEELIICGSTHRGEEEVLLQAYKELLKDFSNLRILIAPRHIDRVGEIERLCTKLDFESVRLSKINAIRNTPYAIRIIILDTIGQLAELYSIATIVFMGGSLVKKGGHNLVEPARFAKPIVSGPHMHNFRDMARQFLDRGASIMVKDRHELKNVLRDLLSDSSKRNKIGENALSLVEKNKGSVGRIVEEIKDVIERVA